MLRVTIVAFLVASAKAWLAPVPLAPRGDVSLSAATTTWFGETKEGSSDTAVSLEKQKAALLQVR